MVVTKLVELPFDGFHISINDYNAISVAINKVFAQNRDCMIAVHWLLDNLYV
jgi:hypothetical protein